MASSLGRNLSFHCLGPRMMISAPANACSSLQDGKISPFQRLGSCGLTCVCCVVKPADQETDRQPVAVKRDFKSLLLKSYGKSD